jgi:hypothetical protein
MFFRLFAAAAVLIGVAAAAQAEPARPRVQEAKAPIAAPTNPVTVIAGKAASVAAPAAVSQPAPDTYIEATEAAQADLATWLGRSGRALARAQ